ncbi:hypothetical protein BGZ58_006254 [Dissophora ornata]|nr:hypothetical protein BGZ58_006254 [Dissophora ornata]
MYTHTVLIQSNPNPASVDDVSWSLVSAWEHNSSNSDTAAMACHVDPLTGIFTMMSNFTGFQYNPRMDIWANLSFSPDYRWGDISNTFTVFIWPNSSTLYQANIAQSNDGTVNLGMLQNINGSNVFVNSATWALNPNLYGYPTYLVFGNGSLYQFGAIVANNRTGAFKSTLTKLPLTGGGGSTFTPPTLLEVSDASLINNCSTGRTYLKFYVDTIYVFCQDDPIYTPFGTRNQYSIQQFRGDEAGSISVTLGINDTQPLWSVIQPLGVASTGIWAYAVSSLPEEFMLNPENFGNLTQSNSRISIPEPYGSPTDAETDHIAAISGGSIAGAFVLLAVLLYFLLRRRWPKFRKETWPRWKGRMKAKILEMLTKDDAMNGRNLLSDNEKIEEVSMKSFDMNGMGKILVTPDMDLSDLPGEGIILDVDTGHMQDVQLVNHPRPAITTSLSAIADHPAITEDASGVATSSRSNSTSTSTPRCTPSALQPCDPSKGSSSTSSSLGDGSTPVHIDKQAEVTDADPDDSVPPYSPAAALSNLQTPSLLRIPAAPSAPPLDEEEII